MLAALHSKAVDFPKSGVPAVVEKVSKRHANRYGITVAVTTTHCFVVEFGCRRDGGGSRRSATLNRLRERRHDAVHDLRALKGTEDVQAAGGILQGKLVRL